MLFKVRQMKQSSLNSSRAFWRAVPYLLCLLVLILTAGIVHQQTDTVVKAGALLHQADKSLILAAAGYLGVTFIMSTATLQLLSLRPLIFKRTLIIQLAGGLATKIAPAGLGGLALNTRYLVKNSHTVSQAGIVAIANNLVGFIGHNLLIAAALVIGGYSINNLPLPNIPLVVWFFLAFCIIAGLGFLFMSRSARSRVKKTLKELGRVAKVYRRHYGRLLGALTCSISLTALHCMVLYSVAFSIGVSLSALNLVVLLTVGIASASVTPTPGGLGGAEAAMSAALISLGYEASLSISVALLYRFISFWLPLLPGFFFFQFALRRHYI